LIYQYNTGYLTGKRQGDDWSLLTGKPYAGNPNVDFRPQEGLFCSVTNPKAGLTRLKKPVLQIGKKRAARRSRRIQGSCSCSGIQVNETGDGKCC